MTTIAIFAPDSIEYARLTALAEALTYNSPNGFTYTVGETFFDFGANWRWTTVLCEGGKRGKFDIGSYQALTPAMQERILNGEDAQDVAVEVLMDKYCPDVA